MARGRRVLKAQARGRKMRQRAAKRTRRQARILEQRKSERRGARFGRARQRQRRRGAAAASIGAGIGTAAQRRARRRAQRQRQRTARQRARQRGRTARARAKAAGGKWSPESTQARWAGISDVTGQVGEFAAAAIPGTGLGGVESENGFAMPMSGSMDDPYGNGNMLDPMDGNGNWFMDQSMPVRIGIVAAAGAAIWFLIPKKKKKK